MNHNNFLEQRMWTHKTVLYFSYTEWMLIIKILSSTFGIQCVSHTQAYLEVTKKSLQMFHILCKKLMSVAYRPSYLKLLKGIVTSSGKPG